MAQSLSVKWTKFTHEINPVPATLAEFKAQLQTLTNVPADRQKLVCKGKTIDDDAKLVALPTKSVIMMIGSAVVMQITEAKAVSADHSDSSLILPPGIANLGNTCWLNSTLKALYSISELREALIAYANEHTTNEHKNHVCATTTASSISSIYPQPSANEIALAVQVGKLYINIKKSLAADDYDDESPIMPIELIAAISKAFPQFYTIAASDHKQQDADDFLTEFLNAMNKILVTQDPETKKKTYLIHDLFFFDIDTVTTIKAPTAVPSSEMNDEETTTTTTTTVPSEEPTHSSDSSTRLSVPVNPESTDIQAGIKTGLVDSITKRSPVTQKDAEYSRQQFFVKLPKYTIVQLQRFSWKLDSGSGAKLIRKVNISSQLDLFHFCTDALKEKLEPYRKTMESIRKETEAAMNDGEKVDGKKQNGGYYDLVSIVSHQGRSLDSGHYVAWTKSISNKYNDNALVGMTEKEKEKLREMQNSKAWVKHDDNRSSFAPDKILTDLSGGGDFHMAYLCIYKATQ